MFNIDNKRSFLHESEKQQISFAIRINRYTSNEESLR